MDVRRKLRYSQPLGVRRRAQNGSRHYAQYGTSVSLTTTWPPSRADSERGPAGRHRRTSATIFARRMPSMRPFSSRVPSTSFRRGRYTSPSLIRAWEQRAPTRRLWPLQAPCSSAPITACFRLLSPSDYGKTLPRSLQASRSPEPIGAYSSLTAVFHRAPLGQTFHAHDIFGPVSAHISLGVDVSELGPAVHEMIALSPLGPRWALMAPSLDASSASTVSAT